MQCVSMALALWLWLYKVYFDGSGSVARILMAIHCFLKIVDGDVEEFPSFENVLLDAVKKR